MSSDEIYRSKEIQICPQATGTGINATSLKLILCIDRPYQRRVNLVACTILDLYLVSRQMNDSLAV